jgi:hypothetical protein
MEPFYKSRDIIQLLSSCLRVAHIQIVLTPNNNPSESIDSMASKQQVYLRYDEPKCDTCEKEGCEASICYSKGVPAYYKACGHGGHNRGKCHFVNKGEEPWGKPMEIIDLFTPKFRAKAIKEKEAKANLVNCKSPPRSPPGGKSSRSSGSPTKPPLKTLAEIKKTTRAEAIRQQRKDEWDKAARSIPKPVSYNFNDKVPRSNATDTIVTNFFEIKFKPKMPLHHYSINLGDIDVRDALKMSPIESSKTSDKKRKLSRERKRYLIEMLLKENPPMHDKWACDYDSTIISVGELWENSAKTRLQETKTPHTCAAKRGCNPPIIKSTVHFTGFVDSDALNEHVSGKIITSNPTSSSKHSTSSLGETSRVNGKVFQTLRVA